MEGVTISEVVLDIKSSTVTIKKLVIEDSRFCADLAGLDDEERKNFVRRALQMGAVALRVMDTTSRVDYVRGEFNGMQTRFEMELERIFSDKGSLLMTMDHFLGKDGEFERALDAHFGEEGSVIFKILNPNDETTPLGKFRKQLQEELDADRKGTAFNKLKTEMEEGFSKVLMALKVTEAVDEEREKGTSKGLDFQNYVYETLALMSKDFEDTVEFVGNETGHLDKTGDVLIRVNPVSTSNFEMNIVFEAKNASVTMRGKNSFLKELDKAKENRGAHYAIGVIHESKTPKSIGSFRRFTGNKIVCSVPEDDYPLALEIAYKMARTELILYLRKEKVKLDPSQLKEKVTRIQSQLETMGAVKRSLKGAKGKIDDASGDLKEMEESIRETIDEIMDMIEAENSGVLSRAQRLKKRQRSSR